MNKQQKKAFEIVIEKIETEVKNGDLKVGDKLPTERVLTETLQVSRTSVREGLRKLEHDGLVEVKHGIGRFITAKMDGLLGAERPEIRLDANEHLLYEMLEFRYALEVESAYLAAQRATSEDLQEIHTALEAMKTDDNQIEKGMEADVAFHMAIVTATHNSVFIHLCKSMQNHMEETIRATRKHRLADPHRYQETLDEHREIYLAIASKEEKRAKELMKGHIAQIRREISESLLQEAKK